MNNIYLNPDAEITDEQMYPSGFMWRPKILETLDYENLRQKYNLVGTHLILLSGVSTAGKDTLLKKALEKVRTIAIVPRATSRAPRPGEIDGVDYFFDITDSLLWSSYGGNIYAVPTKLFDILSEKRKVVMTNGLVYLPVLKTIFEKLGVTVTLINIIPGKLTDGLEQLQETITGRLTLRDEKDQRVRSVRNELKNIVTYREYLEKLGVIFIENTPNSLGYSPEALEKLIELFQNH